jgi:hypothetical protein
MDANNGGNTRNSRDVNKRGLQQQQHATQHNSLTAKKGKDARHSRDADNRRDTNNSGNTRSRRDVYNSRIPATAHKPVAA